MHHIKGVFCRFVYSFPVYAFKSLIRVLVEGNVFRNGEVWKKTEVLINYPYSAVHGNLWGNALHLLSAKNNFASLVGLYYARNYFYHRGFSASVFSHQAMHFAHVKVKINVL